MREVVARPGYAIGKIDVNGGTMRLRGCVAGGLLCSKQTWAKIR